MNVLRNIPWKNPKVWVPASLAVAALATLPFWGGDSLEDKHGREPSNLPLIFQKAIFQEDGVTIRQLATPAYAQEVAHLYEISLAQGEQSQKTFPSNWVLEEFKISEDHYLYKLEWVDEVGRIGKHFRVRKIHDEWKIERVPGNVFDLETNGLTPRIIRGNAQ